MSLLPDSIQRPESNSRISYANCIRGERDFHHVSHPFGFAGNLHSVAIIEKGRLLRVGPLGRCHGEGKTMRRVRLRLATEGFALDAWLAERPGVSGVVKGGSYCAI